MNFKDIIKKLNPRKIINEADIDIKGISYNTNTILSHEIFVCLKGEHTDGHNFAQKAFEKGAGAFLCEHELDLPSPQIIVDSTQEAIAKLSNIFFDSPSSNLEVIGITGTNGKTTVTHLVQRIIEENKKKCALIGTLGHKLSSKDDYLEAKHTTPQAPELQKVLKKILDSDIKYVAMEVSSHALCQNRTGQTEFKGAVMTNLTQDHLDFHITMENYFNAKAILFKNLKPGSFAALNTDDKYFEKFKEIIPQGVKLLTYGIKNRADIQAKNIEFNATGASFNLKDTKFNLHMNGNFSVYNSLAAIAAAQALNIPIEVTKQALERTKSVAGRFEIVNQEPLIIVDYAHTPDGLENVLHAARELTPKESRLICVFGCGGDRDATKRPKMGKIARELCDITIITSDNPRSEDPQEIITDILAGLKTIDAKTVFVEPDRHSAIKMIKTLAKQNDVVLVAGKGHEDYQILKDRTIRFDDREEVKKLYP